jgi:hypothetical protein
VIASFGFQYLQTYLGTNQFLNTSLVFGAIIIFFVLVAPRGILPTLIDAPNFASTFMRSLRGGWRAERRLERRI